MSRDREEAEDSDSTLFREDAMAVINNQIFLFTDSRSTSQSTLRLILAAIAVIVTTYISRGSQIKYNTENQEIRNTAQALGAPPEAVRNTVEVYNWPILFIIFTVAVFLLIVSCWKFLQAIKGEADLKPGMGEEDSFRTISKIEQGNIGNRLRRSEANRDYAEWVQHNSNLISRQQESLQNGFVYLTEAVVFAALAVLIFVSMEYVVIPTIVYINLLLLLLPLAWVLLYPIAILYWLVAEREKKALENRLKNLWEIQMKGIDRYFPGGIGVW